VRVYRDEIVAGLEFVLVAFRFDLGDAHPDQTAYYSAGGRADRGAAERGHDRSRRDEWSDARNGERTDAGQQTEHAARESAGGGASRRAFRRLGGFDMANVLNNNPVAARVIVRGIGPSLTAAGLPNALADPTLELRDDYGTLLIANNDWQGNPVQAAELTAAGLAPANPLEAGLVTTLPPGLYTALLAGLNSGTGLGLIEVYDLGP
jgi:hypothetical protein